jgi:hypothetical protein
LGAEATKGVELKSAFSTAYQSQSELAGGRQINPSMLQAVLESCDKMQAWVSALRPNATVSFQEAALKVLHEGATSLVKILSGESLGTAGGVDSELALAKSSDEAVKLLLRIKSAMQHFTIDTSSVKLLVQESMATHADKSKTSALSQNLSLFASSPSAQSLEALHKALQHAKNNLTPEISHTGP